MSKYFSGLSQKSRLELLAEIKAVARLIPDGYALSKDTLPDQVKLMAEGLHVLSLSNQDFRAKNKKMRLVLKDLVEHYETETPGSTELGRVVAAAAEILAEL